MKRLLTWLGKYKPIAILLATVSYLSIVTFHDEVTQLAIRLRNAVGRDLYNAYLADFFVVLLLVVLALLAWHIARSRRIWLNSILVSVIAGLMIFSFQYLLTYSIEAIHFVEYMIVAILLFPVLRSYGETVFWVMILGILDELFQYFFLVPEFEYFDFNDNFLNLLGAATGAIAVFVLAGDAIEIKNRRWYRSPAVITGITLLALFSLMLITGKMTLNPTADGSSWFSLNRVAMTGGFWKEAYPGRSFHILRPMEGLVLYYLVFAGFFVLDWWEEKRRKLVA